LLATIKANIAVQSKQEGISNAAKNRKNKGRTKTKTETFWPVFYQSREAKKSIQKND